MSRCRAAYSTDEWHGWGCSITEGACEFLYPNSKACAEMFEEGPDAHSESEGKDTDKENHGNGCE